MNIPPFRIFQYILIVILIYLYQISPDSSYSVDSIGRFNEHEAQTLTGTIVDFPDVRRDKAQYVISEIRDKKGNQYEDKVLIKTSISPEYQAYDILEFYCLLETPFETVEFSYKNYLSLSGIVSTCEFPQIRVVGTRKHWKRYLFKTKAWFENTLNRLLPEPHASLAAGLITGSRRGIPDALLESFNTTGLTHIIAISGYNISLVILLISYLLKPFSHTTRFVFSLLAITIFVLFVGGQAAVVRAGIMGGINIFALRIKRPTQITNVVLLTAIIMAIANPLLLRFDIGFKLSFASTLGLIYFSPFLEKLVQKLPNTLAIKESFVLTMSAQVFATPLIVYYFGRLSLISVLANILVAPFIPLSMFFCALLPFTQFFGIFSLISLAFAKANLDIVIGIAEILSLIPHAQIALSMSPHVLIAYYCILIFVVFLLRKNKLFTEFPVFGRLG